MSIAPPKTKRCKPKVQNISNLISCKSSSADSSLEESEQCDYPMQYEEFKEFESIANKNESNMRLDKLRLESETPL